MSAPRPTRDIQMTIVSAASVASAKVRVATPAYTG